MNNILKNIFLSFGIFSVFVATPFSIVYETAVNHNIRVTEKKITDVIPNNTNIGEVIITDGSTKPTESQIISLVSMWAKNNSQSSSWYPNQIEVLSITNSQAVVNPLEWSPNYVKNISTTVKFTVKTITKNSLRYAFTNSTSGSGTINLNDYKGTQLNATTIEKINEIKNKSTELLIWLNTIYNDNLYVNQIEIVQAMRWDTNSEKYLFRIQPKAGSNVYDGGYIDVEFVIPRKDVTPGTVIRDFNFNIEPPTQMELYSIFIHENSSVFDKSLISLSNFSFGPIADQKCTFKIVNSEIYTTVTPIQLSWEILVDSITLDEKIVNKNFGPVTIKPKNDQDIYFLVRDANPSITINWTDVDVVISFLSATLTAKAGSVFYTGFTIVRWTIAGIYGK